MKKNIYGKLGLFLVICVVCTSFISVFGVPTVKQISAMLNYNLTIVKDGEVQEYVDSTGERVYPITYNGTTYLPVRGLGETFGADVSWDDTTNTVTVTSKKEVELVDMLKGMTKKTTFNRTLNTELDRTICFVAGEPTVYTNGIDCSTVKNQDIQLKNYISVPVPKSVTSVNFVCVSGAASSVNVFNQNGKLLKTFYQSATTPTQHVLPIDSKVTTSIYFVGLSQEEMQRDMGVKVLDIFGEK